jgi:hypothetical protein
MIIAQVVDNHEWVDGIPMPTYGVEVKGLRCGRATLEADVVAALRVRPDGHLTLDRRSLAHKWGELASVIVLKYAG